MWLSELQMDDVHLAQNGVFATMGLSSHPATGLLTYISEEAYIPEIFSRGGDITSIIATKELAAHFTGKNYGLIVTDEPARMFYIIHNRLAAQEQYVGAPRQTKIHPTAIISPTAYIAPTNVVIGPNCVIHEHAVIKHNTVLGENVTIGACSVIGGMGFQYSRYEDGVFPVEHCGGVAIAQDVSLHSLVTVDKGLFPWQNTTIGKETKIDSHTHVGHGVEIGCRCAITAGTVFAGSVKVGDNAYFGLNATVARSVIGPEARVSLGAVVTKDVPSGQTVSGNFAIEHAKFLQHIKKIR